MTNHVQELVKLFQGIHLSKFPINYYLEFSVFYRCFLLKSIWTKLLQRLQGILVRRILELELKRVVDDCTLDRR